MNILSDNDHYSPRRMAFDGRRNSTSSKPALHYNRVDDRERDRHWQERSPIFQDGRIPSPYERFDHRMQRHRQAVAAPAEVSGRMHFASSNLEEGGSRAMRLELTFVAVVGGGLVSRIIVAHLLMMTLEGFA